MGSTGWAVPGDLDAGTWYGEQFHAVDDLLFPGGDEAERAAEFLIGLTGRTAPTVTEFGVGTGRLALPLARRGAAVTGLDVSPLMLDACRAAGATEATRVQLIEADIRHWRPGCRSDLVCSVAGTLTFLATATDQRSAVRAMSAAVRPGGTVVVENQNPAFVRLLHGGRGSVRMALPPTGLSDRVDVLSLLDDDAGVWQVEYSWTEAAGTPATAIERMVMIDPDEMIAMASDVGLSWRGTFGDWAAAPVRPRAPSYVCVFSAPDAPP